MLRVNFLQGFDGLVGIDFGADSIKVVELEDDGQKLRLKKCGLASLTGDCIVDGSVMNMAQAQEELHNLLERVGLLGRKAAFGVSGHNTIVKTISLPPMSQEEFDSSIMLEAAGHIPYDIEEVYVDVQIINPNVEGQLDVLLCAAKRDVVNEYAAIVRKAGAEPRVVDVNGFAMHNLFERLYGFPQSGAVALIDLGASMTSIVIVRNGVVEFSRDIMLGGMLLTEQIQEKQKLDFQKARDYQVALPSLNPETITKQVSQLTHRVVSVLVTEIQRSLEFFNVTSVVRQKVSKVYITGGASETIGLIKELQERLEIPVERLDCFKGVEIDANRFGMNGIEFALVKPTLAVAMGLALRRG